MDDKWRPGKFLKAMAVPLAPRSHDGLIYRGIALRMIRRGSPKGRRPPTWELVHIGTGHRVFFFDLTAEAALELATSIAECGEWDYETLEGWRNVDPDLPHKVYAIDAAYEKAHPKVKIHRGSGKGSPEAARAVAMARS
jgi:hypothetical protein